MAHAFLAPSSAHRWVNCPASVQAQLPYPDEETEEAREGTAAHWVGSEILTAFKVVGGSPLAATALVGEVAENGIVITDEHAESAQVYIHDVLQVCQDGGLLQSMHVEEYTEINRVHPLNGGTPDTWVYNQSALHLILWDFKHGHEMVEVKDNWQLIDYAIGIVDMITDGNGLVDQTITVELRIVQPRAFHPDGIIRSVTMKGSDLRALVNVLAAAAEEAVSGNASCKAGNWCKYCTASVDCMTLQNSVYAIVDRVEEYRANPIPPEQMHVEMLYLERAHTLIEERLSAMQVEALTLVRSGTRVPGRGVGFGRGSTKWNKSDAEVIAMGDLMNVNLRKDEVAITPKQAEGKTLDPAVISAYSVRHQGAVCLVVEDQDKAARIFGE